MNNKVTLANNTFSYILLNVNDVELDIAQDELLVIPNDLSTSCEIPPRNRMSLREDNDLLVCIEALEDSEVTLYDNNIDYPQGASFKVAGISEGELYGKKVKRLHLLYNLATHGEQDVKLTPPPVSSTTQTPVPQSKTTPTPQPTAKQTNTPPPQQISPPPQKEEKPRLTVQPSTKSTDQTEELIGGVLAKLRDIAQIPKTLGELEKEQLGLANVGTRKVKHIHLVPFYKDSKGEYRWGYIHPIHVLEMPNFTHVYLTKTLHSPEDIYDKYVSKSLQPHIDKEEIRKKFRTGEIVPRFVTNQINAGLGDENPSESTKKRLSHGYVVIHPHDSKRSGYKVVHSFNITDKGLRDYNIPENYQPETSYPANPQETHEKLLDRVAQFAAEKKTLSKNPNKFAPLNDKELWNIFDSFYRHVHFAGLKSTLIDPKDELEEITGIDKKNILDDLKNLYRAKIPENLADNILRNKKEISPTTAILPDRSDTRTLKVDLEKRQKKLKELLPDLINNFRTNIVKIDPTANYSDEQITDIFNKALITGIEKSPWQDFSNAKWEQEDRETAGVQELHDKRKIRGLAHQVEYSPTDKAPVKQAIFQHILDNIRETYPQEKEDLTQATSKFQNITNNLRTNSEALAKSPPRLINEIDNYEREKENYDKQLRRLNSQIVALISATHGLRYGFDKDYDEDILDKEDKENEELVEDLKDFFNHGEGAASIKAGDITRNKDDNSLILTLHPKQKKASGEPKKFAVNITDPFIIKAIEDRFEYLKELKDLSGPLLSENAVNSLKEYIKKNKIPGHESAKEAKRLLKITEDLSKKDTTDDPKQKILFDTDEVDFKKLFYDERKKDITTHKSKFEDFILNQLIKSPEDRERIKFLLGYKENGKGKKHILTSKIFRKIFVNQGILSRIYDNSQAAFQHAITTTKGQKEFDRIQTLYGDELHRANTPQAERDILRKIFKRDNPQTKRFRSLLRKLKGKIITSARIQAANAAGHKMQSQPSYLIVHEEEFVKAAEDAFKIELRKKLLGK